MLEQHLERSDLLAAVTELVDEVAARGLLSWSEAASLLRPFERLCLDDEHVLLHDEEATLQAAWLRYQTDLEVERHRAARDERKRPAGGVPAEWLK